MKINEFLEEVCEEIKYKPIRPFISEELEEHLLEAKEEKMKQENLSEEVAEEQVTAKMGIPKQIGKELNKVHKPKLDWQLLVLLVVLVLFGISNIILKSTTEKANLSGYIVNIIIGFIIGVCIYFRNYKKLQKFSNMIYLIAVTMNVLALTPTFGYSVNGAKCLYLPLVATTIPTILIVMLYVIAFVGFLIESKEKKVKEFVISNKKILIPINGIAKIISSSLIAIILIGVLPSVSNIILLGITYLIVGIIYIWQISKDKKKVISILCGGIAIMVITLMTRNTDGMLLQRVKYSLNPQADAQGIGYVGMLQKEVIENSKMMGQANTEIVDRTENIITQESNYTFVYLMGKLGILAVGALAITVILIVIKIIFNAKLIKNMYGKMITIGLGTLYILQSVMNILMNLNLGIQTNVNLPFVCEGNMYFIIHCISMAFILSIYRRKDIDLERMQQI